MIRITAELIPYGIGKPQSLGYLDITNDGTGDLWMGNYNVRLRDKRKRVRRKGRVENFWRAGQGVWDLAYLALGNLKKRKGWFGEKENSPEEGT